MVHITVGSDHELTLRTKVAKDFDRVYFTGTAGGAMAGLAKVTKGLLELIPDDAQGEFRAEKVAASVYD